jgi:SAM-dependent methyltransferase
VIYSAGSSGETRNDLFGPHLGFASILEQRAQGGYGAVVDELIDAMGLVPGAVAVDVGCGTGALTRRLARRLGSTGRVVGCPPRPHCARQGCFHVLILPESLHGEFRLFLSNLDV